ncbi:VOC family protein [Roseomonas sp. CAU 1739]|uniref:VOC family protein n=1 Tax=Roseomonas sp. CAU 1739 TaxID=3140364 RepID=UPI00325A9FDC
MSFPFTHAEVFGEDPAALAEFYRAVLGWTVTQADGVDYWRIAAAPAGAPSAFAGGIAHRPDFMPSGWLPYAQIEDIETCVAETTRLGGKIVREPTPVPRTGWYAVIADPEGNRFAVFQHDPKAMPLPEPD